MSSVEVRKAEDFENVRFTDLPQKRARWRPGSRNRRSSLVIFTHFGRIAELAAKNRLPTMQPQRVNSSKLAV